MANKKNKSGDRTKKSTAAAKPKAAAKNAPAATKGKQASKAKNVQAGGKKPAKAAAKDNSKGGPSQWWADSVQFLREVRTELKKVVWPSKKQTISSTGVVLILVVIVSAYLGVVDYILSHVVGYVIG